MIKHHFLPGLYLREARLLAGARIQMHRHKYDHMSVLASGSVEIQIAGLTKRLDAPAFIMVRAGESHVVKALTDVLWYCEHVTDETDAAKIDQVLIEKGDHRAVL